MPHRNLVQARFLFEKAQLLWEPHRDITNGVVVSLLQDASELVLWAIVKAHSLDVKPKEGFVSILEKVNTDTAGKVLHGKAQILEINSSRVNFKHYGLLPSSSDIPKFVDGTKFFLTENTREFLGLAFEFVSLVDEVAIPELRSLLKEAERFRDANDLEEAMVQASLAYQTLLRISKDRHFGDCPTLDDTEQLFPVEKMDTARDLIFRFHRFFEHFSNEHALFLLGVNHASIQQLEERRLVVNVSVGGKRLGIHSRSRAECTLENVNYLISSVTDIARRL